MNNIFEIGNHSLINIGEFSLSFFQVIILIAGIIIIYAVNRFGKNTIYKNKRFDGIGDHLKVIIFRSISYLIWLFGIITLLKIEHVNTASFFEYKIFASEKITITVQKIFIFIVLILILRLFVLVVEYMMNRRIARDNIDYGKGKSIIQITKYVIWTIGILIGVGAIGLKLTFFIASISALLVGVGFGLQNIFNDFFSGIILLFDGSIKVNDIVQVGDVVGRVTDIGIRTTKVLNRDNIILIIPNSKFTTDNVINWSHMDQKSRFSVAVGVAYGSDVQLVERILLQCAAICSDVVKNPKSFVRFEDFGDSSLDFKLYFWSTKSFQVENTKSELRFLIDQKFRENNVSIPFPQRDVHVKDSV